MMVGWSWNDRSVRICGTSSAFLPIYSLPWFALSLGWYVAGKLNLPFFNDDEEYINSHCFNTTKNSKNATSTQRPDSEPAFICNNFPCLDFPLFLSKEEEEIEN
jgi:hypothetical protein